MSDVVASDEPLGRSPMSVRVCKGEPLALRLDAPVSVRYVRYVTSGP